MLVSSIITKAERAFVFCFPLCNPFARSAGIFFSGFFSKISGNLKLQYQYHQNFGNSVKNIPALRAKGLHRGKLNTRACSALVIKTQTEEPIAQTFTTTDAHSRDDGRASHSRRAVIAPTRRMHRHIFTTTLALQRSLSSIIIYDLLPSAITNPISFLRIVTHFIIFNYN